MTFFNQLLLTIIAVMLYTKRGYSASIVQTETQSGPASSSILSHSESEETRHTETCMEPPRDVLHEQWVQHSQAGSHNRHESLYMITLFQNEITDKIFPNENQTKIHLYGDQACPNSPQDLQGKQLLQERSYCPWHHEINYDPNRYPTELAEAKCNCDHGVGQGVTSPCEAVKYTVRVLQRTSECVDGFVKYEAGYQLLSTGCIMVKTMVISPESLDV